MEPPPCGYVWGWGWNPSSVTSCVALTKLAELSVADFSSLENGNDHKNRAVSQDCYEEWSEYLQSS